MSKPTQLSSFLSPSWLKLPYPPSSIDPDEIEERHQQTRITSWKSNGQQPKISRQKSLLTMSRGPYTFPVPLIASRIAVNNPYTRYGGVSWASAASRGSMIQEFESVAESLLQLSSKQIYAFYGSPFAHASAELLSVWYAYRKMPQYKGRSVLLVDGGNIFSPYLIAEYARYLNLSPRRILENIHISRAFTCHQLEALVTEKVEAAALTYDAYLIVVMDTTYLFQDPDIAPKEAYVMFEHMTEFLKNLSRCLNAIVIVTTSPYQKSLTQSLERRLHNHADMTMEFRFHMRDDPQQTLLDQMPCLTTLLKAD